MPKQISCPKCKDRWLRKAYLRKKEEGFSEWIRTDYWICPKCGLVSYGGQVTTINGISDKEIDDIKYVHQQACKSRHGKIRDVVKLLCDRVNIKLK